MGLVQSARLKSHARPVWIGRNETRLLSLMFIRRLILDLSSGNQLSAGDCRISCAGVLSATCRGSLLRICLMPENETPPIVRVVFACTACTAPFEARQILQLGSSGTFTCGFCGDEVHSWSGSYDYADWRSVRRPRLRAAWSWETSSIHLEDQAGASVGVGLPTDRRSGPGINPDRNR
jgi:hypothetical protein